MQRRSGSFRAVSEVSAVAQRAQSMQASVTRHSVAELLVKIGSERIAPGVDDSTCLARRLGRCHRLRGLDSLV
jgi:hypothetical protein